MRAVNTLTDSMRDDVRDDVLYGTMSKLGQKCRQKGKMSFTSAKLASARQLCEDLVQNFVKIRQTVQSLTLRHTRDRHIRHYSLLRAEGMITNIKASNVAEQLGPPFYTAACYIRDYLRRSIYNAERCPLSLPHTSKRWLN
jgi:hypothetical protein